MTVDGQQNRKIYVYGLTYKPVDNLAIKLDYRDIKQDAGKGIDELALGIGFAY